MKKAFSDVRAEAKLTQAAINSGLDTSAANAKLESLRKTAVSLKQALEKVADKTKVDVDVKGAESELDRLQKKVESVYSSGRSTPSGRRSPAVDEEQRLHAIRKNHAQIESGLKRRLQDQQTRDAERAFKNYQKFNPHLRQFESFGDFLSRGKGQYGGDFSGIRKDTLSYVQRRAGIGGLSGVRGSRLNKFAGAAGGVIGGMATGGTGGAFGAIGTMAGTGIGAGVGMLGGGLGALGGPIGLIAGAALGGIGRVLDQSMDKAISEGLKSANLARSFGSLTTGFDQVRDAARDAAKGMQVTYEESTQFASIFAQRGALRSVAGLRESLGDAYGFGRGLGVGQGAGVSFMATMRGTGAASDEKSARRVGLSVADAIQRGGLGPQANEVLTAIGNFATTATQTAFRAPDAGGFANLLAAGNNMGLAGLHAGGMASIIQGADSAVRGGGNMGMGSQMVSLDAIAQLDPSLNVHEAKRAQQGGFFGTIGGAFGKDSAAYKAAQVRLKNGDTSAQADLDRYAQISGGDNADRRIGPEILKRIIRDSASSSEADSSIANFMGSSLDAASVLRSSVSGAGGVDALMGRLQKAGLNIDTLNTGAFSEFAGVATADRGGLDAMAGRLLAGKDFKTLNQTQSEKLRGAMSGGDDALRNVLLQTLNTTGGQLSDADRSQQATVDMQNAAVAIVTQLIPATTSMKDGIAALVEKLAPDSPYAKQMREMARRADIEGSYAAKAKASGSNADPAVMMNYDEKMAAARKAGDNAEFMRLSKERKAYFNDSRTPNTGGTSGGWGAPEAAGAAPGIAPDIPKDAGTPPSLAPNSYKNVGWDAAEAKASELTGVPQSVLRSIRVNGERSNGDQVSPVGARGVYQFMPKTRDLFLEKYGVDAYSDDPVQQARAAALHLKESHARTGDWRRAVAGYNGGTRGEANPDFTAETSNYTRRVIDGMNAPIPEQNRAPTAASTVANGKLDITLSATIKDSKGRPRDDIAIEAKADYKPAPAGV